jgi:clan AA aspartic protease (TIGR02281 family)
MTLPNRIHEKRAVILDPKGDWLINAARGFPPPTVSRQQPDASEWTIKAGPVERAVTPTAERKSIVWEWLQYRRALALAKAQNTTRFAPAKERDWHGIAKTIEMSLAALFGVAILSFLGYAVTVAQGHGSFGGGGSGMGPPPLNSAWHGQICYRDTARHHADIGHYNATHISTPGTAVAENHDGSWVVDAIISGGQVSMVVDTGAMITVIPQEVAEELGLHGEYSETINTANGETRAAPVRVGNFKVGGIAIQDVVIHIAPKLPHDRGLLGTDILNMLGEYGLHDGRFTITAIHGG